MEVFAALPWLSDKVGAVGLLITLVGFGVTIVQVMRARKASILAANAVESVRNRLAEFDTVANLSSAIETMEQIKRFQRLEAWPTIIDLYSQLRRKLLHIKHNSDQLPAELQSKLFSAIQHTSKFEQTMESIMVKKSTGSHDVPKWNKIMSDQMESLTEIIIHLRKK